MWYNQRINSLCTIACGEPGGGHDGVGVDEGEDGVRAAEGEKSAEQAQHEEPYIYILIKIRFYYSNPKKWLG